ncbi:lactonase family protein [Nocardia sp. NPDC003482]
MAAAVVASPVLAAAPATADAPGYHLYVHGFLSDGLIGFHATDTAMPVPIPGAARSGIAAWPQAASPDGRLLYVASGTPAQLLAYTIEPDGRLTPLPGAALPLPDIPVDIAFAPDGRHAYLVLGVTNATVLPVTVTAGGAPVPAGPPVSFGSSADGISSAVVSPDGRHLYAASYLLDQIVLFDVDSEGRVSGERQRIGTGSGPIYPTITPDGRHLYIANERGTSLSGYVIAADGTLAELPASPFPAGQLPHVMSVTPDGTHLYVPNMGSNKVSAYTVADDGTLLPLPDAMVGDGPLGAQPEATAMSPSGDAVWVFATDPARAGQNTLRRYRIGAGGVLTQESVTTVDTGTRVADGRTLTLVPA